MTLSSVRALAVLSVLGAASGASAQVCTFNLCDAGWSFSPGGSDYGSCNHCDWWGYCSHTLERCPAGSTLDPKGGTCTWNLCTGGCGGELPLCDASAGERYTGSYTWSGNAYGVCTIGPNALGHLAHTPKQCAPGWTLQTASGNCRKDCLPDLVIKSAWLRTVSGSYVSSVRTGQPYYLCAQVKNVGTSSAPASVLQGGGLGVPVAPTTSVPALSPMSTADRCLYYSSAPSPGTWNVGLTIDPSGAVAESDNLNNTFNVPVTVTP